MYFNVQIWVWVLRSLFYIVSTLKYKLPLTQIFLSGTFCGVLRKSFGVHDLTDSLNDCLFEHTSYLKKVFYVFDSKTCITFIMSLEGSGSFIRRFLFPKKMSNSSRISNWHLYFIHNFVLKTNKSYGRKYWVIEQYLTACLHQRVTEPIECLSYEYALNSIEIDEQTHSTLDTFSDMQAVHKNLSKKDLDHISCNGHKCILSMNSDNSSTIFFKSSWKANIFNDDLCTLNRISHTNACLNGVWFYFSWRIIYITHKNLVT